MDNGKMYVVPKPGAVVRDPISKNKLPPEGAEVPRSTHWLRRLKDGDVTEGKAPAKSKSKE